MENLPKPGEIATSAVAHVVSKIVPERAYSYLAAFMPGLFFEISLLLANPDLVSRLLNQSQRSFALGRSMIITIALILAFIIGNGFMLIPGLIQHFFFRPAYKVWWFLWKRFCVWPLKPIVEWLLKKPRLVRIPEVFDLHRYVIDIGFKTDPEEADSTWQCWVALARPLLSTRYGIKAESLNNSQWTILYWTLGIWTPEDLRGNLLFIYLEATGWAGLVATRVAPALRTRYYLYFNLLLIVSGLLHAFYFARRNVDPRASGYLNVGAILRELRQISQHKGEDKKPVAGADEMDE